jgi:hypothetical protein
VKSLRVTLVGVFLGGMVVIGAPPASATCHPEKPSTCEPDLPGPEDLPECHMSPDLGLPPVVGYCDL